MTICLSCARYLINLHTAIRFFFSLCVRRRWLAIYPPNDKLPTSTWAQKLVDFCHHSASLSPAFLWNRGSFTPDYCAKLLLFSICVAQNHCSKQKEPGFAHFLLMSKHNQELWFMDMQLEKLLFPGRTQYFPFLSITGVYMMPHPVCFSGRCKELWRGNGHSTKPSGARGAESTAPHDLPPTLPRPSQRSLFTCTTMTPTMNT